MRGVVHCILRDFERAKEDFERATEHMSGRLSASYFDQGLEYELFSFQLQFNLSLTYFEMEQQEEGQEMLASAWRRVQALQAELAKQNTAVPSDLAAEFSRVQEANSDPRKVILQHHR